MAKNVRDIISKGRAFFQDIKNFTKFIEETYDRHYQTSLILIANNAPHLKKINEYVKDGLKAIEKGDFNNGRWNLGVARKMFKEELLSYDTVLIEDKKSLLARNGKAFVLSDLGYVLTALAKIETYGEGIEKAKEARKCFETSMKIQESTNKAVDKETLKGMGLLLITESLDGHDYFGIYEAVPYFKKAIEIYPNDVGALKGLEYALSYGHTEEAYKVCKKLLELEPENKTDTLVEMASLLSLQRSYKEAINKYKEALEKDPQNLRALQGLASSYYTCAESSQIRAEKGDKSTEFYRKAHALYKKVDAILYKKLTNGEFRTLDDYLHYENTLVSLSNLSLFVGASKETDEYVKKVANLREKKEKAFP